MAIDRRSLLKGGVAFAALAGTPLSAQAFDNPASNFHAIYSNPRLRDRFFLFLQNVFHLFPEAEFHQLILDSLEVYDTDEAIYRALQSALPGIKTVGSEITFALPALAKQKRDMAVQTAQLLEPDTRKVYDGYLEIGSTGRYVLPLKERLPIEGQVTLVNDIEPSSGPIDILERGSWSKVGDFKHIGNYDRIDLDEGSVDLVTNFIGFHHCPNDRLDDFIDSVRTAMRPGGRLVVRDHDVDGDTMNTLVALAHDVFNAGVYLSWEDNAAQLRHFRSKEQWTELLAAAGFERDHTMLAQAHDPTDNVLMAFRKV